MKNLLYSLFLFAFFSVAIRVLAQEQTTATFALRGVVRDQGSVVLPGLRLHIKNEETQTSSLTDINGEFSIQLADGNYVITADNLAPDKFRAFIKISDKSLNPNYVEFVVDANAVVCGSVNDIPYPKILSSISPAYPPAAKAVRAMGEVEVRLKISPDGRVFSFKAIRGHPLLRKAAEIAAEKFIFASDETTLERELSIVFVFLPEQSPKAGLIRYECPYRIVITSAQLTLDISS